MLSECLKCGKDLLGATSKQHHEIVCMLSYHERGNTAGKVVMTAMMAVVMEAVAVVVVVVVVAAVVVEENINGRTFVAAT